MGATDGTHHQDHGHDDERGTLECHHDAGLTHGRRCGNDHDGQRKRFAVRLLVPVRAVLIVNPNATSTTPAGRDLLAHALESRVSLTVAHTDHRGHAIEIASDAARDGIDVVIVHGGDGTVNEVVNGILGDCGQGAPARKGPAVGVVPGGAANVFARALGISSDPTEATNQLVDLLDEHRRGAEWRRIGLMDCGERWAVFTAGMGVDGAVVAAVEAQREKGRKVTASRYIRIAVREMLAGARREPELTLHLPGRDPVPGVHFAFVSNSSPWTYANTRPIWTNPDHDVRDRSRRLRDHQHERVDESGAGAADVVSQAADRGQASDPRRRPRVGPGDQRHSGGLPDRRRLRRPAGNHDVHVGTECSWRRGTARENPLTWSYSFTGFNSGRK